MLSVPLLCFVGFTSLCLSMGRHYGDVIGGVLSAGRSKLLRLTGWVALLVSFWVAMMSLSVGLALVHWFAALMSSAMLWVFVMSYWPRLALSLAGVGALLIPVAACIQLLA